MARIPVVLPFRLALRELRGGLQGFRIFLACLAIGVAAISGVGSVSSALKQGLAESGQAILGGDIELQVVGNQMTPEQRSAAQTAGETSDVATVRAMARANDIATVVEVKAIDDAYPLYGTAMTDGGERVSDAIAQTDGIFGAVVEETFLARFKLERGGRFRLGRATFEVIDTVAREPDRVSGGFAFGPRVLITRVGLESTGLIQPGSLIHWNTRIKLADGNASPADVNAVIAGLKQRFPDAGWRIRDRTGGAPGIKRFVDRLTQFLTLIGLTSLVVGGVGVANAISTYIERKRADIATLKSLGARGGLITSIYLWQVFVLALAGSVLGAAVGAIAPFAVAGVAGDSLPVALAQGVYLPPLATGILFGLLVTLVFSLWPLGRAREVRPAALFRDLVARAHVWPRPRFIAGTVLSLAALVAATVLLSEDRRFALIFIGAVAGAIVFLILLAALLQFALRRIGAVEAADLRLAIGNLVRPGSGLVGIVLSFGLGVALMVAVALIDRNLSRDLRSGIPDQAPSFFFLDIQRDQKQAFVDLVGQTPGVEQVETGPMLRGRILRINDVPADQIKPEPGSGWVLRGDRGLTYSDTLPENSRLVSGEWWPEDYDGEPLVSFVADLAEGLGLKIGDTVTVNVLGRPLTARIANLRDVEWDSFEINFIMVFSASALEAAPHSFISTVTMAPEQETALLRAVIDRFANVTAIPVKDALESVADLLGNLLLALRIASIVTLVSAALVLGGAMAAGQHRRLYEASILKALGARRSRVMRIHFLEYGMLGVATALFAGLAGTIAAYVIIVEVIKLEWTFSFGIVVATATAATAATILLGTANSWRLLGHKPAPLLRAR